MSLKNDKHPAWNGYEKINGTHWCDIKRCARSRNIEFDIDKEYAWNLYIEQGGKCALSGVDIRFSDKSVQYYKNCTASLDRIDNNKGYIKGNVQWTHKKINQMRLGMSIPEFVEWCCLVKKVKDINDS